MPETAPTTELREAQDRFVQENMRRIFLLIYRFVRSGANEQIIFVRAGTHADLFE